MKLLAGGLQVFGFAAVTGGCALIAPWLALVVGGAFMVLVGVAFEVRSRGAG